MYLDGRQDDDPALWMGRWGPLTVEGIYRTIKKRGKEANVTRIHPHLFRKTFATWWVRYGGDEQRLMALGGWASPEMLQVYVQVGSITDLIEAHRRFGLVDNMLK